MLSEKWVNTEEKNGRQAHLVILPIPYIFLETSCCSWFRCVYWAQLLRNWLNLIQLRAEARYIARKYYPLLLEYLQPTNGMDIKRSEKKRMDCISLWSYFPQKNMQCGHCEQGVMHSMYIVHSIFRVQLPVYGTEWIFCTTTWICQTW